MSNTHTLKKSLDGDSPQDTQEFIEQIREQLNAGFGFVPFIGAGFSAPSGAPLVHDLEEYLQRCVCISLGIDSEGFPATRLRHGIHARINGLLSLIEAACLIAVTG